MSAPFKPRLPKLPYHWQRNRSCLTNQGLEIVFCALFNFEGFNVYYVIDPKFDRCHVGMLDACVEKRRQLAVDYPSRRCSGWYITNAFAFIWYIPSYRYLFITYFKIIYNKYV